MKAAGPDYMVTVLVTYVTELETLHAYSIVNVHVIAQFVYKTYSGQSYLMNVAICIKKFEVHRGPRSWMIIGCFPWSSKVVEPYPGGSHVNFSIKKVYKKSVYYRK